MDITKVYSLNEDYILRHDKYRSFIASREKIKNGGTPEWVSMIHPEQAKLFSFFTHGLTLNNSVEELSKYIGITFKEGLNLIKPYIDNDKGFYTSFNGNEFEIPQKFIIQGECTYKRISITDFEYETLDFETKRVFTGPMFITLMLSNVCITSCIYCYADTNHKVKNYLPLVKIKDIIRQAYELNVNSFSVIGGEIFSYPDWKEVLIELKKYSFYPDIISTKKPLNEKDIAFLESIGIKKIQFSFDSISEKILSCMLGLWSSKSYRKMFTNTLDVLNKRNFEIQIAITLTNINSNVNDIKELLDFLSQYASIVSVNIGPAFYSLYREINFSNWGISKKDFIDITKFIDNIKNRYEFTINLDTSYTERGFYSCSTGSSNFSGASCSANQEHMFILPDGQVTICEQLYWNKNFIVGNVKQNSIVEIWNSPKSILLANLQRKDFSNNSACKSCKIFEGCHSDVNKCWADIIKAYGDENWDYPDPRCSRAPLMFNNLSFL
ncbi:MAG TPA: radical SAM protein [Ignavibacteria bacterium]|nr:radical SAM protein [Ignavibacteria bacterium]